MAVFSPFYCPHAEVHRSCDASKHLRAPIHWPFEAKLRLAPQGEGFISGFFWRKMVEIARAS